MKLDFKTYFLNPFQKNIATLLSGALISQIINVIGALVLAKIYAPELYGSYSVFLSFVGILAILNSLKLEYIVITEKSEEKSINMVNTLLVIILLISILHLTFFFLFRDVFLENGIIYLILLFSSIASLFLSKAKVFESYANRKLLFKSIANSRVIMSGSTVLFQFILFYFSKNGLIYGFLLSMIITLLFYLLIFKRILQLPNLTLFKETFKSHKNILHFAFPSGLINSIGLYIMPILILSYFSASASGVYSLSLKVVSVPLFIISSSVSQVYFQKASDFFNHSKHKLYNLTKKVAITNILIMFVILILINTLGLFFLDLFFDKNWVDLDLFVIILSFYMLGQACFVPISSIIVIVNKMHIGLIFNVSLVLINIIAIYIGYKFNNIIYTVLLLSIIGGLGYILLLFYFLSLLKTYKNEN